MVSISKQSIGVDCSKDELVVCYGQLDRQFNIHLQAPASFANTPSGINRLLAWADKRACSQPALVFVVEATGVYHQQLAHALHTQARRISVVLPSRARYFAKTLKVRTVTDRTASKALAQMGLEKNLDRWHPPHPLFGQLKQLTRERKRLKDHITTLKNQRHAAQVATGTPAGTLERMNEHLQLCQQQVGQIEQEIKALINENKSIKERFEYACSIDGVGLITAATVISEANGFALVRNVRQLVSYAGYDVVQKQSGSSVRGKPRISKQGNTYIRRALYFPAISAVQKSNHLSMFYQRLYERHKISMKAYTAVQRKLLILIYTMWTKQVSYDPHYQHKKEGQLEMATPHELA